jgi:hypothetical protein
MVEPRVPLSEEDSHQNQREYTLTLNVYETYTHSLADMNVVNVYDNLFYFFRRIWKSPWFRVGAGCLVIAFFTVLVVVAVFISVPSTVKSARTIQRERG